MESVRFACARSFGCDRPRWPPLPACLNSAGLPCVCDSPFYPMKTALLAALLSLVAVFARAADTAYTALRAVGKQNGEATLDRIVEVRARGGMPHPEVWKIIIDDPQARGGIREVDVQRGKIIGERTPTGRPLGKPMNFNQLNLDSEGAFTVANQEAAKSGVPFERIDYVLKSGTGSGAPVWELQLQSAAGGRVGSIQIAADSGTVLRRDGFDVARREPAPPYSDRPYVEERRTEVETRVTREPRYARESGGGIEGFFERLGRRMERRSKKIENFFTGRRSSGSDSYEREDRYERDAEEEYDRDRYERRRYEREERYEPDYEER